MRLNHFIVDLGCSNGIFSLADRDLLNQIRKVLRMKAGDRIVLSNGKGREVLAEILEMKKDRIEVRILEELENMNEPVIHAILYCSILKKENFEWAAQKACESGVHEIVPIIAERTVKRGVDEGRLRKIMKEAAEQSERKILPTLQHVLSFKEAIQRVERDRINLLFDRNGSPMKDFTLERELQALKHDGLELKVNFFIGPEGGWTSDEIWLADQNNFRILNLSRTNLRSETAVLAASFYICQLL